MNRDDLIERLSSLRPVLQSRGITHLAIYGSRSRGDQRPNSDLDMIVDVDPETRFSLLDLIGIEHLVTDATGIEARGVMRRSIPRKFQERVASDLIEVF